MREIDKLTHSKNKTTQLITKMKQKNEKILNFQNVGKIIASERGSQKEKESVCIHSIGPQLLHNGFYFDGMSKCHCFHINTTTSQDRQSICLPRQSGDRPRRRRGRVKFVNPLQVRERYLPTAFDQLGKEKGAEMQQVRWTEKGRERDEQVRNFEKGSRH